MSSQLFETDINPAPAGISAGLLQLPSGVSLRYALLKTGQRPAQGTVVLLQGRNEFIEKYYETMSDLAGRGFNVATFDWRGQGGSTRLLKDPLRGYVRRFSDYVDDLDQFLGQIVLPDCPPPFYILAHSMGALIAIRAMPRLTSRITRMVLCAPLLGLRHPRFSDATMHKLATGMRLIGLGGRYASEGPKLNASRSFDGNPLTQDRHRFERNQAMIREHGAIAIGGPTVAWLHNVLSTLRDLDRTDFSAGSFNAAAVPALILSASADPLISPAAIERFVSRNRYFSLVSIDGARHELLQEQDFYREQVWAAFDAFIPGSAVEQPPAETELEAME